MLTYWKKWHHASYQAVTLLGMWIFPIIFAVKHWMWKLIITWIIFTATTAYITYRATRQPLPVTTPRLVGTASVMTRHSLFSLCYSIVASCVSYLQRLVYWYFFLIHKLSSTIGMGGYILAVADFLVGPYLPQPANTRYFIE